MEADEVSTSASADLEASSSDSDDGEEMLSILNEVDDQSNEMQNIRKSDMRKVVCGLTKTISNYYGKNCEESMNDFNVITEEMSEDDFEQAPFLLQLKNVLEERDFLYEIRPNKDVKESFFFLQDKYMRTFYGYYPDFICVDILCELPKLKLNFYLFIAIDTNGTCEIIALGLLKTCDVGIKWLCDTFIKHNQKAEGDTKIILSNKILRSNEVFQNAFLGKPILTSFFHFMQSLKEKLFNIGFNANDEITKKVMIILEKMSDASDETEWSNLLEELKCSNKAFLNINNIWNEIKEQWVLSKKFDLKLIWRSFNIFLYSIRKSLRPFICSLDTIEKVLKHCSYFIENSRQEKFKNLGSTFQRPVIKAAQVACFKYSKILTPFAAKLVFGQIDNCNCMMDPSVYYEAERNFHMNATVCACSFCDLLSLPCLHVFGFRKLQSSYLFNESICEKKWFKESYKKVLIELFTLFFEQMIISSFRESANYFGFSSEVSNPYECYESASEQHAMILKELMVLWDQQLNVSVLNPPSASNSSCLRALESYKTRGILSKDNFEQTYGISLNDILNCEDNIS